MGGDLTVGAADGVGKGKLSPIGVATASPGSPLGYDDEFGIALGVWRGCAPITYDGDSLWI
eukprot:13416197-Alexandrium_andersonii.AAC.1